MDPDILCVCEVILFLYVFSVYFLLVCPCRPIRAMPVVMTNSLGQMALNSPPILTTTTGVPVTVASTSASTAPKLVIQALPTMLPAGSKAGEKITIITIPANQLATLMQANPSGHVTQLIQAKPVTAQLAQAAIKPQLILAKPATVAQALPQMSVQSQLAPTKSSIQPPKRDAVQSDVAAEALPTSSSPAVSVEKLSS